MKFVKQAALLLSISLIAMSNVWADKYDDTVNIFKTAGESAGFFDDAYGYALFPNIGKGGFVVGAAAGKGRVYEQGVYVGDSHMGHVSVGLQLGAQSYAQVIFFQDKAAFDNFTSDRFEFSVQASAVVITAAASASGGTTGSSATASGGQNNAVSDGAYVKGMAVFTVVKGGLMYETVLAGQKYDYTPLKK